jgi:hypothetical protein
MFYLALSSPRQDFKHGDFNFEDFNPESLTPRFMLWQAGTWLLDLRPVWPYWCHQAGVADSKTGAQNQETLQAFLRKVVTRICGEDVIAVMDASPWRALIALEVMRDRGLSGFVSAQNPIGRNLVNEASWDIWFRLADEVAVHWFAGGSEVVGGKGMTRQGFNLQVFRRQARQMAQAMIRLGIHKPAGLVAMPALAIRRRYGAALHDLWMWTIESNHEGFPWILWRNEEGIQVKRHLDMPLLEWEHIESVLREDLDRLCVLLDKQGAGRVLSLEWRVVFLDFSSLSIPIRFRHPHDLPAESPHHRTALLQACYAFQDSIPAARDGAVDLGLYEKAIASWELAVTEKIHVPPVMRDLFGALMDWDADMDAGMRAGENRLQQLENRLPVPLTAYEVTSNWVPEDGYRACAGDGAQTGFQHSLKAIGRKRPLFVYPRPRVCVQPANQSRAWTFCERIMDKWWRSGSASVMQRDYYMMQDQDHRAVWVFKDGTGKWYVHGMYN